MQGVVVAFRVVDGCLRRGDVIRLMNTKKEYQVDEVGVRTPAPVPVSHSSSCSSQHATMPHGYNVDNVPPLLF